MLDKSKSKLLVATFEGNDYKTEMTIQVKPKIYVYWFSLLN